MGKRINLATEEKVCLVEEYIAGRITGREAARRAGVGKSTMQSWISRYRAEGIAALRQDGNQEKSRYDKETRRKAVEEYLSGRADTPDTRRRTAHPQCRAGEGKLSAENGAGFVKKVKELKRGDR